MNLFVKKDNLFEKYQKAKEWTEQWSDHFDEFMRIVRNEAPADVPKEYANVADGTTAALVRKTPKRVVQQLPTGTIEADDENDWLPIVAEFILLNKIIPFANTDYDLIQKFWTAIENGSAIGGQAVYTPFVQNNGEFTTDLKLVYYGDIFFQPGKNSFYSCDYIFIRSWWQPETIDQIIENEQKMAKIAKKNGEKYESSWDIQALKKIKKNVVTKDDQATTESEESNSAEAEGIEIVTCFQKGVGATFFTFNPRGSAGTILRTKKNKDPRGKMPVDYFYADVDGSNPFGRSMVELVGGMQNMIDGDMRAYKFNRALGLAPPLLIYGNVDTTQEFYAANALISMGTDQRNKIEPLSVDTTAIRDYANNYSLNKTQLLNLINSGGDTSIDAEVGNPGFGKTPFALKQQKEVMSADDNYLRKNFESFFENWAETAINVYFAEREGVEELQLDQKTADRLRKLEQDGKLDQGFVGDDNKIVIDYSSATPALHFRVNASTSKLNGQSEQLEALQLLLQIAGTPSLAQIIPMKSLAAAWNKVVTNSGVDDPNELLIDIEELEQQQAQAEQAQTGAVEGEVMPEQAGEGTEMGENEYVIQALRERGVPDEIIMQALEYDRQGVPAEDILAGIERLMNGR